MKSIAFLLRFWPYFGGGETVTRLLTSEFLRRGYQVHILYWWDRYEDRIYSDDKFVKKLKVDAKGPFEGNMTSKDSYHGIFQTLKKYVDDNRVDYIINQWWPAEIFEDKISAKIITCHHANVMRKESSKNIIKIIYHKVFYKSFIRKGFPNLEANYLKSDLLVFLAKSYKDEFDKYSTLYSLDKNTAFIHNPCSYVTPVKWNDILPFKKKEVLFVGRIYEEHKKLTRLLQVWDEILKMGVNDWFFKIVGDGPDLPMIKKTASQLCLTNVEFLGAKNPEDDYRTASIFIMASAYEGWPMTIVEAQHYGAIPVVMNTFSALSDMMSDDSGVIVNSENPRAMAQKIVELMKNKDEVLRLSNNAIKKSGEYQVCKIVTQWENILKGMN